MIIALQTLIFFRETLVRALDAFLRPYFKKFSLTFTRQDVSDDEDSEDHAYAEYHDEKGVVFFPPVYVQRYASVTDCLMDEKWHGRLEKVVDFGYHCMSFIKYLKDVPGIQHIMGVDIETIPLQSSSELLDCEDYIPKRENPLKVTLFEGNAADPDYRLIGCDAVVAIEMIEHMLPHDLDRFVHTVFGFIKPWVVILTTPNGDFNVLFKSLERNGLRRLDHFFEWSREQFHDWCSNIVLRYPQYTVSCKGIGPGPPDTVHLGSCSQMAVFVAKDYHKQQDLDLNSLAVVTSKDIPSLSLDIDMTSSYECIPDKNMLCLTNEVELYPELSSHKQSCVTIVLTSPIYSYHTIEYSDKALQCNLDTESAKRFLFEDETCNVLVPRRRRLYRIYDIEDVNNRLNCSTLQVKKFSKTTQNMMAKNKTDSLVHTREVVDEIRHLTKMLNFKQNSCGQDSGDHIWYNINWGENAPYWNQYYKVVRDYNYPFERKSDECRILDLISDEVNRLVDKQWDEEFPVDVNRLEIPLEHLMEAVKHITDDVDKVKELLEWNGYQIVDNLVVHSRLVVDATSMGSQDDEWPDNDTVSDWDTSDVRSTSISDGSTNIPDYYGRCLRRALDHKVRKLRTLLSVDEDITSELDRVVCRLMKLALHTSRNRQTPVPTSWVQCKLFDLLTLTEKAIERRRRHYLEEYAIKSIEDGKITVKYNVLNLNPIKPAESDGEATSFSALKLVASDDYNHSRIGNQGETGDNNYLLALANIKQENDRADKIMYKYRHLVNPFDDSYEVANTNLEGIDLKDDSETIAQNPKTKLDTIREWVGVDSGRSSLPYHNEMEDQNTSMYKIHQEEKSSTSVSADSKSQVTDDNVDVTSLFSFDSGENKIKIVNKNKRNKTAERKITRKSSKRKLNYTLLLKNYFIKFGLIDNKTKTKLKGNRKLQLNVAAPIPSSLIELCESPKKRSEEFISDENPIRIDQFTDKTNVKDNDNIAASENSCFISIITQDTEEQIVLRRSLGTDPDSSLTDHEAAVETVINVTKNDSISLSKENNSENIYAQTIFLYDINEPSTSKGIRHTGLDVQCGPDEVTNCPMLSATTSFTKLPKLFSKGIKIEHSRTNLHAKKNFDAGTSPNSTCLCKSLPTYTYTGIRINDSDTKLSEKNKTESSTMTSCSNDTAMETTLIKPVSILVKTDESSSECNALQSPVGLLSPINKSDVQVQSCHSKTDTKMMSPTKLSSKLSCGGIYIHSFKDKEMSEDVVYQGGWNEMRPDILAKKNLKKVAPKKIVFISKKVKRSSNTSVKNLSVKTDHALKRPIQIRTQRQTMLKKEQVNKTIPNKKPILPVRTRNYKFNKNVKKVSSKNAVNIPPKKATHIKDKEVLSTKSSYFGKPNIENYLPPYLKRNRSPVVRKNYLSKSNGTAKPKNNIVPAFIRSNTEEINRNSLKVTDNSRVYVSYQVFRNEVDDKIHNKRITGHVGSVDHNVMGNNSTPKRSCSPESLNSSDSTPNSIGTVRAVPSISQDESSKICSTSLNISDLAESVTSGFKTNLNSKLKRNSNKIKNENKENIPVTGRNAKLGFVATTKKIFRAHMNAENSPLHSVPLKLSKSRPQAKKSTLKLPNIKSSSKLLLKSSTSLLSKKVANDEDSSLEKDVSQFCPSDTVIVLESNKNEVGKAADEPLKNDYKNEKENSNGRPCSNKDSMEFICRESLESSIKLILEEKLNLICSTPKNSPKNTSVIDINSNNNSVHESLSLNTSSIASIKTINEKKTSSNFKIDLEDAIYSSFNKVSSSATINLNDTGTPELRSFDSICSSSKHSEYFLADNQLDLYEFSTHNNESSSSVQGIFERKDNNLLTNIGAPIALQAFSGFSMNAVPLTGDQPDYINLVDPETGSLRPEVNRQAESEEILVSGRSSDTYESCSVEEDTFVPSWLFNIISQQQSMDESSDDEDNLVPFPIPLVAPMFDVNGNLTEASVGAGAGAGDGRGMHSDHSQDSSGRGTSISSSETSTDTPNEAILVDPSAFLANYEYVRDTSDTANLDRPNESPDTSFTTAEADNNDSQPRTRSRTVASDIDADVSSLDTDIADSDN